jgi:arginyl-tRNA synthetase
MTPEQLRDLLVAVAARAAVIGALPEGAEAGPPPGRLFHPADPRSAGVVADWVTPVAQRWVRLLDTDLPPRAVASTLAQGLSERREVAAVEVAPSGLIAITLDDATRSGIIPVVQSTPETYAVRAGGRYRPVLERPDWRAPDDPLRSVQLSHARLCRLLRNAAAAGVQQRPNERLEVLGHVAERHLLVAVADLPQRLDSHEGDEQASTRALVDLGHLADAWDHPTRPAVVGASIEHVHGARMALADTVRIVLRNGLARLGAAAPERM